MSNCLQKPFSDIIGKSSPVQQALKLIWTIPKEKPFTITKTEESKSSAALILTHLLSLMNAAGFENLRGFHSAAITLFRPIEDATDCFAAVGLNAEAAVQWAKGDLKGSEAAKIWIDTGLFDFTGDLSDYRKNIRKALNYYSYCSPGQTEWNVYLESIGNKRCIMELNTMHKVININAYYIDRYLCIHLYELLEILFAVYKAYWNSKPELRDKLKQLQSEIKNVVLDFLKFINEEKLDLSIAPEIGRIR